MNKFVCPYCGGEHYSLLATVNIGVEVDKNGEITPIMDMSEIEDEVDAIEADKIHGYCIECFGTFDVEICTEKDQCYRSKIRKFIPIKGGEGYA
nr:MAG TPA: zinc finger domain protein [Caudoviricetes sp.]